MSDDQSPTTIAGRVPVGAALTPVASPMAGVRQQQPTPVPQDPFSRVIDLPSGGLYYPSGTAKATICPTRGEQEEAIAGTPEESPERIAMVRQVAQQCTTLHGLEFEELLVKDFGAVCMHLFALSAGTDEVNLGLDCPGCKQPITPKPVALTLLPCTYLRRAEEGEGIPKPDAPVDDPAVLAAMAVEAEMAGEDDGLTGPRYQYLNGTDTEPFTAVLDRYGYTIQWRYLRILDLIAAEKFAIQTGSRGLAVGDGLGAFVSSRQIVSVNGRSMGVVGTMSWWRQTLSPILRAFRDEIRKRNFGYDMRPELQCMNPECRRRTKVRLPNDGSLFRPGNS